MAARGTRSIECRDRRLPLGNEAMARPAIHPGEILADELEELAVSPTELARQIRVPANRITQIIQGKRAVTGDTALRLGHWFGMYADFIQSCRIKLNFTSLCLKGGHIYLVALRTEDIKLPNEIDGYQYIDLFVGSWQFKLARSINLKYEQLGRKAPEALSKFISTQETNADIKVNIISSRVRNFEIEADYFLFTKTGQY